MNFAFRVAVKRWLLQLAHVSEELRDGRLAASPCAVNRREIGLGAGLAGKGERSVDGGRERRARAVLPRPGKAVGPANESVSLPVGIGHWAQAPREVRAEEMAKLLASFRRETLRVHVFEPIAAEKDLDQRHAERAEHVTPGIRRARITD